MPYFRTTASPTATPPTTVTPPATALPSRYGPGHIWTDPTAPDLELNQGLAKTDGVYVQNIGDRPIQVGSHAHLADINPDLKFFTESEVRRLDVLPPEPTAAEVEAARAKSKALAEQTGDAAAERVHGNRFDIRSGASLRFEPMSNPDGPHALVAIGGKRLVPGIRLDKRSGEESLD
ncbi:urease subunit beta [Actinokineospora sp. G85]|uniref:urease subunit beta n=1 Tax=Actinokineospora sp. G85 TaxID=3406626 RepID=UPI003C78E646